MCAGKERKQHSGPPAAPTSRQVKQSSSYLQPRCRCLTFSACLTCLRTGLPFSVCLTCLSTSLLGRQTFACGSLQLWQLKTMVWLKNLVCHRHHTCQRQTAHGRSVKRVEASLWCKQHFTSVLHFNFIMQSMILLFSHMTTSRSRQKELTARAAIEPDQIDSELFPRFFFGIQIWVALVHAFYSYAWNRAWLIEVPLFCTKCASSYYQRWRLAQTLRYQWQKLGEDDIK